MICYLAASRHATVNTLENGLINAWTRTFWFHLPKDFQDTLSRRQHDVNTPLSLFIPFLVHRHHLGTWEILTRNPNVKGVNINHPRSARLRFVAGLGITILGIVNIDQR